MSHEDGHGRVALDEFGQKYAQLTDEESNRLVNKKTRLRKNLMSYIRDLRFDGRYLAQLDSDLGKALESSLVSVSEN